MFMGEFEHSLDAKGRLIIPVKFREALGEHFVITKGLDECLFIFPEEEWKILENKLKALPLSDTNARRFVRFFFSGAVECEKDGQGRVLLPAALRKYAGLLKEVISIGVVNRIEVWSKEAWENYNDATNFVDSSLAEKMAELGI